MVNFNFVVTGKREGTTYVHWLQKMAFDILKLRDYLNIE